MKPERSRLARALALLAAAALLGPAPSRADGAHPAPPGALKPNEEVLPFEAEGVDGVTRQVNYPKGSATVLLFFLSSCPTCHKMIPEWNRAFEKKPRGVQIYGIMLDREPPDFFQHMKVAFPVLRAPNRNFARAFKVPQVPFTIRVLPGGKVEDVGIGILDPIKLGELFRPL